MFTLKGDSRLELLKTYQEIVKSKGHISLGKLLFKRKLLYIALVLFLICGIAIMAINPLDPIPGTAVMGVAFGAFVADVSIVAAVQRALPLIAKLVSIDRINELIEEYQNSKK